MSNCQWLPYFVNGLLEKDEFTQNDKILCEWNGTIQHMDTYLNATRIQYIFLFE